MQAEEQVVQMNTNTSWAVVTLVTQSKENIWLTAVSATTQHQTVTMCTLDVVYCGIVFLPESLLPNSLTLNLSVQQQSFELPDEESAQCRTCEYFVSLLHHHWAPVVTAVLELLVGVFHQFILSLASEWTEVCG